MPDELFDITIIGSGPAGLYGAFYAGMRGMKTKILDALPELGGQLVTLYPEKLVFDVGGFPRILARDLAKNLVDQAMTFDPTICLDQKVTTVNIRDEEGGRSFEISTDQGVTHFTKTIVLTAGIGAFKPKKLDVPGVNEFEGKGIHYFVKEKEIFRGQQILIVGGGDSAVDWSINLLDTARNITLIHRRDQFRAHEESVKTLKESPVNIMTFHELKSVRGNDRVEEAVIYDNRTNVETLLNVDSIILNLGFHADLGPIKEWGLDLDKGGIVVNYRMETNVRGIFAAGDVASHPGKLKLISTGFGEAVTAVNFAKKFIDPKAKVYPGHSTDLKNLSGGKRE